MKNSFTAFIFYRKFTHDLHLLQKMCKITSILYIKFVPGKLIHDLHFLWKIRPPLAFSAEKFVR